jgi:uncharacterized membrane protein
VTDAPEADPETEAEASARAADRLVFFSDAVIAIAITLLALDLPVPEGTPGMTNIQLLDVLWNQDSGRYIDFLISFAVIGNHWASHRHIFRYVNRVDSRIGQLNMIWLLTMILTPVATRLLSGDGADGARFAIYTLVQILASLCLLGMSWRIQRAGLLRPDAPDSARHPDWAPYLAWVVVFAASIPVAFVTAWAYAVWAAVPVATRLFRRELGTGPRTRHRA